MLAAGLAPILDEPPLLLRTLTETDFNARKNTRGAPLRSCRFERSKEGPPVRYW